jgi:hypothetical protein
VCVCVACVCVCVCVCIYACVCIYTSLSSYYRGLVCLVRGDSLQREQQAWLRDAARRYDGDTQEEQVKKFCKDITIMFSIYFWFLTCYNLERTYLNES